MGLICAVAVVSQLTRLCGRFQWSCFASGARWSGLRRGSADAGGFLVADVGGRGALDLRVRARGLGGHRGDTGHGSDERDLVPRLGLRDLGDEVELELVFAGPGSDEAVLSAFADEAEVWRELRGGHGDVAFEECGGGFAFADRLGVDLDAEARLGFREFAVVADLVEEQLSGGRGGLRLGRWRGASLASSG